MNALRARSLPALVVAACATVAATLLRRRARPPAGYRDTTFWRTYDAVAESVDRRVG